MTDRIYEKWMVGEKGGPAGPFYSVVSETGRVIAMQIPDKHTAELISQIPQLVQWRFEWSSLVNSLARIILGEYISSNNRDEAEDAIDKVLPYLDGTTL